jgi:hypothetical protein
MFVCDLCPIDDRRNGSLVIIRGSKRCPHKRELYARLILLSRCNDASRPYEVGARHAVPFLDCPSLIGKDNDNWYEMSFRRRTGGLGVAPSLN